MNLVQDIDKAFELVKKPSDNVIVRIPDDPDSINALKIFNGKTSAEICQIGDITEIGILSAEDLYQMTPYAVHYYLPCYLKYLAIELEHWEFCLVTGIIEFLNKKEGLQRGAEYPNFSPSQIVVISDLLKYVISNLNQYDLGVYADEYVLIIKDLIQNEWCSR